jgi:WD40 repeat protein/energy-coupling factor transporter ATP-binding protein EcfA2
MSDFPYPGLRPFQRHESDIFFGREEHTDQLIEKIGNTHFIAVLGPSGCGKSSLVRTGLLAGLETGFLAIAGVHWQLAELRPGNNPFFRLANALLKAFGTEYSGHFTNLTEALAFLQVELRRGPLSLQEVFNEIQLDKNTNLLLLVDQFEEIFRYYQQGAAEESAAFIALLLAASQHPNIYIVITMRSDFLGEAALFHDLPQAIAEGLFLTPRLSREQLQEAIEGPANMFSGEVEPALVNRLLNDAGSDPDQLPLLQHALMRMWNLAVLENSEQIVLKMRHYKTIGGLTMALSKHADEAYAELKPTQKQIAETLFCNLSEVGNERRDMRRPVKLKDVAVQTDKPWQEIAAIVEVFRQVERSFLTPPIGQILEPNSVLDVSHESLIRQWQRLKLWIKKEAESAELYLHLEDTARRWKDHQAELWSGLDLENTLAWHKRTQPSLVWAKRYGKNQGEFFDLSMRFLEASVAKQQEKILRKQKLAKQARQLELQKVRQGTAFIIGMFGIVLIVSLAFWVYSEHQQAVSAQELAEKTTIKHHESQFQSKIAQASLLAQNKKYTDANKLLNKTKLLDYSVPKSFLYTRNLLSWFVQNQNKADKILNFRNTPTVSAIAPNGKQLVLGFSDGTLLWYSLPKLHLIGKKKRASITKIQQLVFTQDSNYILSSGSSHTVKLWQLKDNNIYEKQEFKVKEEIKDIAVNKNILVIASNNGQISLVTIGTEQKYLQQLNKVAIHSVDFDNNGTHLLTNSGDYTQLWQVNLKQQQALTLLQKLPKVRNGIAKFSPDNQLISIVGVDGLVRIYSSKDSQLRYRFAGMANSKAVFSPNSNQVLALTSDANLRFWDLLNDIELFSLSLPSQAKHFNFSCTSETCYLAILLRQRKLLLYVMGKIYE